MQSKILRLELKELNYNALPIKLQSTVETLSYAMHHSYIYHKVKTSSMAEKTVVLHVKTDAGKRCNCLILRPFPHNPLVLQVTETAGTTQTSLGIKLTGCMAAEY